MSVTLSDQDKLTPPTAVGGAAGHVSAAELADRVLSTLTAAMDLLGKQAPHEPGGVRDTALAR
ncbi:hypothetical protein ABB07_39310 (plasmid) [Streptomyces incarnatus]|uniref:Uncharacterized protein n=1 Tax=Streptomyces incarnatus TaxID=665007 RepID=A0ABM5TXJ9_9ACTN|nr:hypothetical protein [Streptomyces incarnatus]AKJ15856.1 hypothetical protein ABB07_39310 [Streptomyces incarnatus]